MRVGSMLARGGAPLRPAARRVGRAATAAALALVATGQAAACGSAGVWPAKSGITAAPRPADCHVDFLRHPPPRPYDELGELAKHVSGLEPGDLSGATLYPHGARPEDLLRQKACEMGADAVIVTQDTPYSTERRTFKMVAGVAIKYRDAGAVSLLRPPSAGGSSGG